MTFRMAQWVRWLDRCDNSVWVSQEEEVRVVGNLECRCRPHPHHKDTFCPGTSMHRLVCTKNQ